MNQFDNVKKIFLLGGHDLEMTTIKKILEQKNLYVSDKGLCWSDAKLCQYEEELKRYSSGQYRIYGIELQEDGFDKLPENYERIDHHNELQDRSSALEQVAEIIGYQLTEEERLIAENDKGYYPAMEKFLMEKYPDMSKEDRRAKMDDIRRRDRKAQGVTEEEEDVAEGTFVWEDEDNGYKVVTTNIEHFSPICDRLWPYQKLIVIRPFEGNATLCYYGSEAQESYKKIRNDVLKDRADSVSYSGGGEDGYWGIKNDSLAVDDLVQIVKSFVPNYSLQEASEALIQSAHIFCFPFSWEPIDSSMKIDIRYLKQNFVPGNWRKGTYNETEKQSLYNELNYFFPFVHNELYEYSDELGGLLPWSISGTEIQLWKESSRVLHFERNEKECSYEIVIKIDKNTWRKYSLKVEAINLNLYSMGIGVLSIYAKNTSGKCLESDIPTKWSNAKSKFIGRNDILKINQYGRRVMPPFYADVELRGEIAESLCLRLGGREIVEDFSRYHKCPKSWKYSSIIEHLLYDFSKDLNYKMVIDDRMFVMSWYKNYDCSSLSKNTIQNIYSEMNVNDNDSTNYWYRFLFVDNSWATCQNEYMRNELLKKHSYVRWTDRNSIYGVTRYSFMMLTDGRVPPYLLNYFETIYARMVELVLMQRATVLKFSERINMISISADKSKELLRNEVNRLCQDYIVFKNQFYFKEVTAQDQGIEMYYLLQKSLRLEEMVKDLDEDIQELYQYHSILEEQEGNRKAQTLNVILGVFTPAAFVVSLLSYNHFISWGGHSERIKAMMTAFVIGIPLMFLLLFIYKIIILPIYNKIRK